MTQKWKTDPSLYSCEVKEDNLQIKKKLDYDSVYINEFLDSDPLRDWESIERCIKFFNFCMIEKAGIKDFKGFKILDCGTKDGQMPEYLNSNLGTNTIGIEISDNYVKYAKEKNRPVYKGDVCCLPRNFTEKFDIVFSHHLLGLTSDYYKGLCEMFRVTKIGGYMMTLNSVPGNKRKHYSYIESTNVYDKWLLKEHLNPHKVIYYGNGLIKGEKIIFIQKTDKCKNLRMRRNNFGKEI